MSFDYEGFCQMVDIVKNYTVLQVWFSIDMKNDIGKSHKRS